jgi:hypothetical protein
MADVPGAEAPPPLSVLVPQIAVLRESYLALGDACVRSGQRSARIVGDAGVARARARAVRGEAARARASRSDHVQQE